MTPSTPSPGDDASHLPGTPEDPVVVVVDRGARVIHFNAAAERVSQRDGTEAVGRRFWELIPCAQQRMRAREAFGHILSGHAPPPVKVEWGLDAGNAHALLLSYTLVRAHRDTPPFVVCTGIEVERHPSWVTSASLGNADPKLSGIIEVASDAIISVDERQRITLFNRGAEAIFGYDQEEILGRHLDLIIPARHRKAHRSHVKEFGESDVQARRMGERQPISGLRRSGEEFPAEASISKIEVDGERIFTVVLRDVSREVRVLEAERFLAEVGEVLASSLDFEETLASVAELTVKALADLCAVDIREESGKVRRLKVANRLPEMAPAAVVLETISLDRSQPHLASKALEAGEAHLHSAVSDELLREVAQGTEHLEILRSLEIESYMVIPLRARDRILGVLLMIATRGSRPFDAQDLDLAKELGLRAGLAVDNARLYQEATQAIQTRDETLGIVSHDLGNPLQTIFIALEALERSREQSGPKPDDRYLSAIRQSADLMHRLIHDLLELRRMEEGHLVISPKTDDLFEVIEQAVGQIDPLARVKGVLVENEIDRTLLPSVPIDGDRIHQVLSNLLGNAVNHTPAGKRVRIRAVVKDRELRVAVHDSGPGIPDDEHSKVFERFWRAENAAARGIGLGLTIAKGIVEGHGGRIWVDSRIGEGSQFSFSLPLNLELGPGEGPVESGPSPVRWRI